MKQNTDLHMHTTASDGGYTPRELLVMCKQAGLEYVAICDHDTIGGLEQAIEEGKKLGVHVIPGIEFSTKEMGVSVHMLGYGIDITSKPFVHMLNEQQILRKKRMEDMLERFGKLGIHLDEKEIMDEADGGSVGRPHIARILVKREVVSSVKEAFDVYLGDGKPCYVKKDREMTPIEAMNWIKKVNGVAVAAHPVYYELDDKIEEWVKMGLLDGVEVYHRDHSLKVQAHYENFVQMLEQKYATKLLRTGGSDFHHESYGRAPGPLGSTRISNEYALALIHKIDRRKRETG